MVPTASLICCGQWAKDTEIAPVLEGARRLACILHQLADADSMDHSLHLAPDFFTHLVRIMVLCKGLRLAPIRRPHLLLMAQRLGQAALGSLLPLPQSRRALIIYMLDG